MPTGVLVLFVSVVCVCVCVSRSVASESLRPPWTEAHQAPRSVGFSR